MLRVYKLPLLGTAELLNQMLQCLVIVIWSWLFSGGRLVTAEFVWMLPGREHESTEDWGLLPAELFYHDHRECTSSWTPMVVLPVFQQLLLSHITVWEPGLTLGVGRNHQNTGDLACLCPVGQVISVKESWTKILAHTQRPAVSLCWNGIHPPGKRSLEF